MKKTEILNHWQALPDDSVLVKLRELLRYENQATRLQLNYQPSKDRETGVLTGSWNCYIQVHERGGEAQAINAAFGRIASAGY